MAIKGFAAVLAALVVVAGGMSTSAFAGKGEVRDLPVAEDICAAKWPADPKRYATCVENRGANIAVREEEAKNKALDKCDMLSPKNAKLCKCSIDPALPICSASLS
ncbi:hypothetical protein KAK06_13275 [Ideonella sp. 4Y11]|uniref:Uncharacterized protein n=1 Tax=Ideonella aquatica TaxID=2824119 RepID=A0A940YQ30_9BURK|nr:hypothetical protein [Ideonella aquatica]MBQ0959918.1 hypothetical protein [Ideonella aquatica]